MGTLTKYVADSSFHHLISLPHYEVLLYFRYNLCKMTKHLAVYLLDLTMDRFAIEGTQIYLVAIGCLLIACEYTSDW